MIRIFFLSQSSPILELFPFDKITLKSYICTVVTVMAKQCWSQTVLESGSWGHSVLQTPALVCLFIYLIYLFIYLFIYFIYLTYANRKHSAQPSQNLRCPSLDLFEDVVIFIPNRLVIMMLFFRNYTGAVLYCQKGR